MSMQVELSLDTTSSRAQKAQDKVFSPKYMRNRNFVDRPDVFKALDRAIMTSKNGGHECKPVVVCGLGGMGKSEIAREFCYRHQSNYQYIFWIDADTETTLQTSFLETAQAIGLPKTDNAVPHMLQWLQSNEEWLIVFDNADDYSLGNTSDPLRLHNKYFPKTGQGIILMTTRNAFTSQDELVVNLDEMKMNDETALKLLLRRPVTSPDDYIDAVEIAQLLGHLPLAIDFAGAYMKTEGIRPSTFLLSYKEAPTDYLGLSNMQESVHQKTVLTVWNMSFARIESNSLLASSLLRSFAFLYPDNIPFAFFSTHAQTILGLDTKPSRLSLSTAIVQLRRYSLVRRTHQDDNDVIDPGKDTLAIHRLVQEVILSKITSSEKMQWCERLISALNEAMSYKSELTDKAYETVLDVYVPHARYVTKYFGQQCSWCANSKELTSLLLRTVKHLYRRGIFDDVEDLAKLALSSSEAENGSEHLDTAAALSNLSYLYASQHKFKVAEPYGRQALTIFEKASGLNHKDTIASLHDLAYIYHSLDMETDATTLYKNAAEAGDKMAQKELAYRYYGGIGVPVDSEAALHWLCQSDIPELSGPPGQQIPPHSYEDSRIDLTPLHHAVRRQDVVSIRNHAMHYKQFANMGDKNGQTALHWAARSGHVEIVRLLMAELEAAVNTKDKNGWTPLYYATANGHIGVAKLLKTGFDADIYTTTADGRTPLHGAASNGHVEMVKILAREFGIDVNAKTENGRTPLHGAAANGHTEMVRILAGDLGADVSAKTESGRTPLHEAAENGHIEIVKLLVSAYCVDVNARTLYGQTPLQLAAQNGYIEIVMLLVSEFAAEVKTQTKAGQTPLHSLARDGHIDAVKLFVCEFDADVNIKAKDGHTPLHWLAKEGHVEMIKLFVAKFRADVNIKNDDGLTPLHWLAQHIEAMRISTTELQVDLDKNEWMPLHRLAQDGNIEMVKLLVTEFGADVDAKDKDGQTPLHWAAENGHLEMMKLLVTELGASVDAKDKDGQTPLH